MEITEKAPIFYEGVHGERLLSLLPPPPLATLLALCTLQCIPWWRNVVESAETKAHVGGEVMLSKYDIKQGCVRVCVCVWEGGMRPSAI